LAGQAFAPQRTGENISGIGYSPAMNAQSFNALMRDLGATLSDPQVFAVLMLVLTLVILVGVVFFWLIRGRKGSELEDGLSSLAANQAELAGRLAAIAEAQQAAHSTLAQTLDDRLDQVSYRMSQSLQSTSELTAKTLNERLDKVSAHMGETLQTSSEKTAQTLNDLTGRLAVITEAQKNITELSTQVVGLQDILSNKQARGAFGEVQLKDIVTNALPPSAYSFQTTLSNGKRADCMILLPNPPGPIAIDAKFPLDAFQAMQNAADDVARTAAERQFKADMLKHVQDIADKYIVHEETAESALLFLPSEAVYAELHARFADAVERSYRARVWIVSPTTLMATLNTVRAVLRDVQMREQAHLIQREVHMLMADIGRLGDRVGKLRTHFDQADKDIKEIGISTDKITRRGSRIQDLELGEEGTPDLLTPADTGKLGQIS